MPSVGFYTLGCKLNFTETSALGQQFRGAGFDVQPFEAGPDVYVINTCSVTDHADRKCRKVVREALKHNPKAFVAVVGCYAQLKPQEIAEIPGVDVVLGAADKFRLLELVGEWTKQPGKARVHQGDIASVNAFVPSYSTEERTRSFLKVQDGCDYKCSFCTIPQARGASRSDALDNVLRNVESLVANGAQEIVLTGVNLGDYGNGLPGEIQFLTLVQELDAHPVGPARYRISSIEPNLLSDEIIHFVASSRRFAPHFHIPLQSGSDAILARMRRRYKSELYASRVQLIRKLMPHAAIGVDVIVGFPGETDAHFAQTQQFIANLDVAYLHVFPYSERANTPAATMRGRLPERTRNERTQLLRALSERKRQAFYAQQTGCLRTVLWEDKVENGLMLGWTENYVRCHAPYDPLAVNTLERVCLLPPTSVGGSLPVEPCLAERLPAARA